MTDLQKARLAAGRTLLALIQDVIDNDSQTSDHEVLAQAIDALAQHAIATAENALYHLIADAADDHHH